MTQSAQSEDLNFTTHAVPLDSRTGRMSLTMAWWGVCSAMFYLVVAASLAQQFGTLNAIIGMLLSVVVYGVINGIISSYAIRTGLSVALFSRVLFGNLGAMLATFIFFATALYYGVFESSVMAVALADYFPAIPLNLAYLIVVVYGMAMVFGSIQAWLDRLNGVLLPLYLLGLAAAVVMVISQNGYSSDWLYMQPQEGASPTGWWNCFTYYMGVWVLMMYTFDYARYGRPQDSKYHAWFNFGVPFYLVTFFFSGLVGIFLVHNLQAQGEAGVVLSLLKLMGLGGLIFIWATQTRINTANFHLATNNLQAFVGRLLGLRMQRWVCAVLVGAISYFIMLADVFSYILQALAYQGVFVVAWVGIALTHIITPTYGRLFADTIEYRHERLPAINPCGMTAWVCGTMVGLAMMHSPQTQTWSAPATFVVSALAYALLLSKARKTWFVVAQ